MAFAILFLVISLPSVGEAEELNSSFDSGTDGWIGAGGILTYETSGGNPGGFIEMEDNQGTFMTVVSPVQFSGNLSEFLYGEISFDAINVNGAPPNLVTGTFGTVTIVGASATSSKVLGGFDQPIADATWRTYFSTLEASEWEGDLAAALANVVSISVELESNADVPAETNGFDNFRICRPILGDVNCDGVINLLDVEPFVNAVTNGNFVFKADINGDGAVNLLDVSPFVNLLSGG